MKKPVVLLILFMAAALTFSQDGFGGIFDSTDGTLDESKNRVTLGGEIGFTYGSYFDDTWNSERIILPYANLNLLLTSETVEAKVDLILNIDDLDSTVTMGDFIDELTLRTFYPFGYLDLGLFKTEWGKGDGIHVIDPLNPLDQSNGISSDINEMKRSEVMAKINFYIRDNGLLEIVYKPNFHPIETAALPTDRWNIKDLSALPPMQASPDTETPVYSQAAVRVSTILGIFDLGGMYYYGYMTEPGYEIIYTDMMDPATYKTNLIFTRAQLFGLESGWALGPFTFRTEGGYWLTEDWNGTEAHLYNDRVVWLAGFDIMIPGTSIFVSVQEFGSYVINFNNSNPLDMDLSMSYNDNAMTNTIIASVEGSFFQDRMKLRLAGLYLFEANGYMVLPTYIWNIEDDLELSVTGQIFGGDDEGPNPYYAWRNNDSITLRLKYTF